jgi:hypothetical protein
MRFRQKRLTDDLDNETKEQGRVTQPVTPIAGRSELEDQQTEPRLENRRAQVRQSLDSAKRWLRILSKDFRRRLYRATFVVEVIGVLVVCFYAVQAWQANKLVRQSIESAQRPYVSLGKTDGTVAEFRPNGDYTNMIFWFHNGGRESAHDFTLNVCTVNQIVFTNECTKPIHIRPILPPVVIQGIQVPNQWVGVDFPGNTDRKELRLAIKTTEIEDAKRGVQPKGRLPFEIVGTIEYTDAFGEYCCKPICVMWNSFLGQLDSCWDPRRRPISGLLLRGREPLCPDIQAVCD